MAKDHEGAPNALAFSHATFAKLTPNAYLKAHLQSANTPQRPNGRKPDEFRDVAVNSGSLANSNGSAVVRLGDTAVVCGVRGEILMASDIPFPPSNNITDADLVQHLGLLVPNLELSTGCSPAHLPGNPPSSLAQSLTWRLHTLLHTASIVDIDDLRIQHTEPALAADDEDRGPKIVTKAYWTLYIDILCMSLDGNCFDAAWIALMAALRNTKLPRAAWDPDRESILCSSHATDATALHTGTFHCPSSFSVFEKWTLADPDTFEEDACTESLTVTVDEKSITRIEKSGGRALDVAQIKHCLAFAVQRRRYIVSLLTST